MGINEFLNNSYLSSQNLMVQKMENAILPFTAQGIVDSFVANPILNTTLAIP